jgi:hypothetical protein
LEPNVGLTPRDPNTSKSIETQVADYIANEPAVSGRPAKSSPTALRAVPPVRVTKPMIGVGAAIVLVVAATGLAFANSNRATVADDTTRKAATPSPTTAARASGATAGRPAAFDPCMLVTEQESSTILEKTVTSETTTPGLQCTYRPRPAATWSFQEGNRVATIRIDSILLTFATGADAQSRFDAKQTSFGKDRDDQTIAALGDKAIYTGGTEVSLLQGSRFLNVRATGDRDWGIGNTRYEDVHQKFLGILTAFARTALPRMP